jgi:hypothetical protein
MKSASWTGSENLNCNSCHGSDADPEFAAIAGAPNYRNAGADQTKANSHQKHVSSAGDCQN